MKRYHCGMNSEAVDGDWILYADHARALNQVRLRMMNQTKRPPTARELVDAIAGAGLQAINYKGAVGVLASPWDAARALDPWWELPHPEIDRLIHPRTVTVVYWPSYPWPPDFGSD